MATPTERITTIDPTCLVSLIVPLKTVCHYRSIIPKSKENKNVESRPETISNVLLPVFSLTVRSFSVGACCCSSGESSSQPRISAFIFARSVGHSPAMSSSRSFDTCFCHKFRAQRAQKVDTTWYFVPKNCPPCFGPGLELFTPTSLDITTFSFTETSSFLADGLILNASFNP